MSQVALRYKKHLGDLQNIAKEKNIHFADLLITLISQYEVSGHRQAGNKHDETGEIREERLIEIYQIYYYESIANKALQYPDAFHEVMQTDAIAIKNARKIDQNAVKEKREQAENLNGNRLTTEEIKNKIADKIKMLVKQLDEEQLRHPLSDRRTLYERAIHIEGRLRTAKVEIAGKQYSATMSNGIPYTVGTIMNWITY